MAKTRTRRFIRPGRHDDDRAIVALAVPALGALAADPLYSLADTAFVGNLGTAELGAVAIGTAAFTASFWLFSFLAYGVTPRVARALAQGDHAAAGARGELCARFRFQDSEIRPLRVPQDRESTRVRNVLR